MTVSIWRDHGADSCEVDVAIVGGGITGVAIARECVKKGLLPAIIEARDLAAGASGRNAGFAMTGLADHYSTLVARHGRARAREIWLTSQENLAELVTEVGDREGIACDLVPCGSVLGAWTEREAQTLEESYALLREDGFEVQLLSARELLDRTGSKRFRAGMHVAADRGVHPVKLVRGIAERVRQAGGRVFEGREVRAIESGAKGVQLQTTGGVVRAGRAILATNAYSRSFDPYFAELVEPVRGQVLATAPTATFLRTLIYTDDGFQYARQLPDGCVVVGGARRTQADREVGYADETTSDVQRGIEEFLYEAWPTMVGTPITHRWSGVMGFSPDGLPLVGVLPNQPNVLFAVGFTGHGLGFALVAARAVVELATTGRDPGIFDARRLATAR